MKQRIFAAALALCAACALCAQTADDFQTWKNKDGTLDIKDYTGTAQAVVIPQIIKGKRVTGIWFSAFRGKGLTSVTIPASVTGIGFAAFSGNPHLAAITVGEANQKYANWDGMLVSKDRKTLVCYPPEKGKDAIIPNGITAIGESAFMDNQLTSVIIPNSVTAIGKSAFMDNQLTSVIIPNSVTTIGESAFSGNRLTSVAIPNGLTKIERRAFSGNKLTGLTLPEGLTVIGEGAFSDNQLTGVSIPAGVTEIGMLAFKNNPLTGITIGANVTLGRMTLYGGPAFPNGFDAQYTAQGKQAGAYALRDEIWSRQ